MPRPTLNAIAPCFIVSSVPASVAFYRDQLNFAVTHLEPAADPFFAIVERDHAMLMLKAVGAPPAPNASLHPWARWDAYINTPDPDSLAAEFASRNVAFSQPLQDTTDGLRGFELRDPDGYVIFFGRPREN
ncbi:MAG: VOC family protein [Acidobacteriota bacterium]